MTRTPHSSEEHGPRPAASFHRSPAAARQAPCEEYLYVAAMRAGTSVDAPDLLAVVDTRAESETYGQIVHETPMPYVGDELHHFGWNRCSSACHGPDRSHLIIPGFRSSRDRRRRTSRTTRCGRGSRRWSSRRAHPGDRLHQAAHDALHARRERRRLDARRRRRQRRGRLRGHRREDVRGQGPLGERRAAGGDELRLLVPAAQEHARLERVRCAERVRAGLRPRRRGGRPLRTAAPLLEPRGPPSSSRRSTSARTGSSRSRFAGSTTRRRTRASSERRCPPPSGASTARTARTRRARDRGRPRRPRQLADPGAGPDHRPRPLAG